MRKMLKKSLKEIGYNVSKYDPRTDSEVIVRGFFDRENINVVFDVGANTGQYASNLRASGYSGNIVSFEPLSSAYSELQRKAQSDPQWHVCNMALGSRIETAEINIAANSFSSSLLEMAQAHIDVAPKSAYSGKESISVVTLDSKFDRYATQDDNVFLKIDTQGFTKEVLAGSENSISRVKGLLVEMSLITLYADEPLIGDVTSLLYEKGFVLAWIEPELFDPRSGQLVQVNGIFFQA